MARKHFAFFVLAPLAFVASGSVANWLYTAGILGYEGQFFGAMAMWVGVLVPIANWAYAKAATKPS